MLPAAVLALRMVLVYPGAPGSSQEAQGFLDGLSRYLEKHAALPAGALQIVYENDLEKGKALLRDPSVAYAIVSMPALCASGKIDYRFVCLPLVSGKASESVSILTKSPAQTSGDPLGALRGKRLAGTVVTYVEYTNALVLDGKLDVTRDFVPVPVTQALQAVRAVNEGRADAALLSQSQFEALAGVLHGESLLTEQWKSPPIPGAPLLALSAADPAQTEALRKAFLGMAEDADGAELCDTMGVTGFVATGEEGLAKAARACWGLAAPAPRAKE